ncbi:MAG: UDP-N-acetylglucosamine 2-epimerase (non-hydrolyzing) [Candidatus Acidiferrales bacterium]
MTILGTRPEIIRLSQIIPLLDRHSEHILVDTGQNYDASLSELFFRELKVRRPDISLGVRASGFGDQVAQILSRGEQVLLKRRPDRVLILGDTNSGLMAIVARRLDIPVYHLEAGNRCYDFRVPEESNRRMIDHLSSVLMPYTNRSRENLLREGIAGQDIFVVGNPIYEVLQAFADQIAASTVLSRLDVKEKDFFLVTMHRAENVDFEDRLRSLIDALELLHERYRLPIVASLHPRTKSKAEQFGISLIRPGLAFCEPFGFFDFIRLEQSAFCVLSDSGTVQEEACIMGVPNVTIRDVTERPETIECGSSVLAGADAQTILNMVSLVTQNTRRWQPPAEYLSPHVSDTVAGIVLGYRIAAQDATFPLANAAPMSATR